MLRHLLSASGHALSRSGIMLSRLQSASSLTASSSMVAIPCTSLSMGRSPACLVMAATLCAGCCCPCTAWQPQRAGAVRQAQHAPHAGCNSCPSAVCGSTAAPDHRPRADRRMHAQASMVPWCGRAPACRLQQPPQPRQHPWLPAASPGAAAPAPRPAGRMPTTSAARERGKRCRVGAGLQASCELAQGCLTSSLRQGCWLAP